MSLRDLCASAALVILLFLAACNSPTGGIVVNQEPTGPRDIVVNSTTSPVAQPVPAPAPLPAPKEVIVSAPAPEIIVIPANKPPEDPVEACLEACTASCENSAVKACGQSTGAACKTNCGTIIDPSACSTACSLRDAHACEPKFIDFCTAKCAGKCH
jgi:hypothetical protein